MYTKQIPCLNYTSYWFLHIISLVTQWVKTAVIPLMSTTDLLKCSRGYHLPYNLPKTTSFFWIEQLIAFYFISYNISSIYCQVTKIVWLGNHRRTVGGRMTPKCKINHTVCFKETFLLSLSSSSSGSSCIILWIKKVKREEYQVSLKMG